MVSPNKLAPVAQTTLKEPLAPCTVTRCRVRVRAVSEPRQPRPLLWAFCACPGFHEHAGVCLKNTSVLRYYDNIDASLAGYSTVALQLWLQLPFCIQIACTWYTQDLASIWIFPCTYRPAFSNCTTFVWDNLQPCQCQNLRMKKCWFTSEFHIELLIKWTSSLSFNYPPNPPLCPHIIRLNPHEIRFISTQRGHCCRGLEERWATFLHQQSIVKSQRCVINPYINHYIVDCWEIWM